MLVRYPPTLVIFEKGIFVEEKENGRAGVGGWGCEAGFGMAEKCPELGGLEEW